MQIYAAQLHGKVFPFLGRSMDKKAIKTITKTQV